MLYLPRSEIARITLLIVDQVVPQKSPQQKAYIEKIMGDLPMNMKPVYGIDNEKPKTSISDMYGMNRIYEEMKKQTELLERIVALWQN